MGDKSECSLALWLAACLSQQIRLTSFFHGPSQAGGACRGACVVQRRCTRHFWCRFIVLHQVGIVRVRRENRSAAWTREVSSSSCRQKYKPRSAREHVHNDAGFTTAKKHRHRRSIQYTIQFTVHSSYTYIPSRHQPAETTATRVPCCAAPGGRTLYIREERARIRSSKLVPRLQAATCAREGRAPGSAKDVREARSAPAAARARANDNELRKSSTQASNTFRKARFERGASRQVLVSARR
jgi:hypothetical protein